MGVNQMRGPTGLKLPLNHNRIKDSILKWVKNHKKAALLLGSLPVTVPLFYFADVWAIGSLAAVIHDLQVTIPAFSLCKYACAPLLCTIVLNDPADTRMQLAI
ncbi:hypothetical protein [Desulfoscipio gibsoniae]|uniref:hypothetical protein n=1 Tax=Desulfoscipio gibsoniae TaxID=102134 RepID=UPI000232A79F|nr:hypothetical protein [Desulfoscipio gibsoniae]